MMAFWEKWIIEKTAKIDILEFINLETSVFKKSLMSASLNPHRKTSSWDDNYPRSHSAESRTIETVERSALNGMPISHPSS